MNKFYGKIGFAETIETSPGVWTEEIVERNYYGDIIMNVRRLEGAQQVNDNLNVNNRISIVSDPYANSHFHDMRYIELFDARWKVNSVEVQFPRLILTVGNVYNN